jgi:hypothetical protein
MEIPNDSKKLKALPLNMLREFRSKLEDKRLELAATTKTVNDRIAELEEEERKARGPNPLGVSMLGRSK